MRRSAFLLCAFVVILTSGTAQNTAGDATFGASIIHDVHLDFPQTGWWDSLTANYTTDIYMRCHLTVDGTYFDTVGVKFKGNSSYNNPSKKKSFKVGIDEFVNSQKYDGLKKFNLNNNFKDPSFMREKLMCDFANQMGANCPRCTYARVYLNGVYWGLYNFVEEVDKNFLGQHFVDKKGNLYKGDPHGDLRWLGSSASSYYSNYELKTNTTGATWADLVDLIDKINNTPSATFYDSLEIVAKTTSILKAWAITNIFADLDSYLGSGHNYYIYSDSTTGKFHYILWDVNEAFGNFNMGMNTAAIKNLSMFWISNPAANRPLYNKMLANATYKTALINEYCTMVNYFNNTILDPKIDSLKNLINADVQADTMKFYSYNDFLNNINSDVNVGTNIAIGLKPFISGRNAALVSELASWNCFVGIAKNAGENFTMYPNPASSQVKIACSEEIKNIALYDIAGLNILCDINKKGPECFIDAGKLPAGIYFIKVNKLPVKKLVISK